MKRRTFLQLFTLPALAFMRPRADPPPRAGLVYSDSVGATPETLNVLKDDNVGTGGVSYAA